MRNIPLVLSYCRCLKRSIKSMWWRHKYVCTWRQVPQFHKILLKSLALLHCKINQTSSRGHILGFLTCCSGKSMYPCRLQFWNILQLERKVFQMASQLIFHLDFLPLNVSFPFRLFVWLCLSQVKYMAHPASEVDFELKLTLHLAKAFIQSDLQRV